MESILDSLFINHSNNKFLFNTMKFFAYIYYRLVGFYKNTFGIDDSPGFLIQSCYSWGLLILISSVCFYLLSVECIMLCYLGIKMSKEIVLLTIIPFALFHIFADLWLGDEKKLYNKLCKTYENERLKWFKGIMVLLFVLLSIPCYMFTFYLCK